MQRKKGHFNAQTGKADDKGGQNDFGAVEPGQKAGNVRHVEGAGNQIQIADAQQIEAGPDGSHKNIVETGHGGPVRTHADEGVARQGCDFQQDVKIEGVTGGHHAQQAHDKKHVQRVIGTEAVRKIRQGQPAGGD